MAAERGGDVGGDVAHQAAQLLDALRRDPRRRTGERDRGPGLAVLVPDRGRDAAQAVGVLLVVDRVAAFAGGGEFLRQALAVGERARGVAAETTARQRRAGHRVRHRREHRLAHAGCVQRRAGAELGRHPHQFAALDLLDEHGLAVVDDGEVGRLAGALHQALEVRVRLHHQVAVIEERAAHAERAHADQPFAARALLDVACLLQRGEQAVRGGGRQREALGDGGERRADLGGGERLEQREAARQRLGVARPRGHVPAAGRRARGGRLRPVAAGGAGGFGLDRHGGRPWILASAAYVKAAFTFRCRA